ncbi:hypothetical protein NEFER03_0204 [Nematocida sp. LUAm3]|nr:hypothetical protein NEFER03_0204 [Nematocida sp. LUAm3]KAI5173657.1 hypothetical protein NEFER02_0173 [Nematocida sp. LUAm2]KAI5176878.1 hypothetical protein NEFER01_0203 [Nematocida sp. LUAm1]
MTKKGAKAKETIKPKDAKKLVDEQMFGMKNKGKSAKLKKIASTLEASYMRGKGKSSHEQETVQEVYQKVPVGIDPKAVFCINYKNNLCNKEEACKFSHEPDAEKRAKILFKLAEEKKATEEHKPVQRKDLKDEKICKYYIDALKTGKHNPKWVCPNGNACPEKHAPPEGYSLKDEGTKEITIEEYIETERLKLPEKQTPMTEDLFNKWKKDREAEKHKERRDTERIKEENIRLGKFIPSGKDLFVYNPNIFVDDEEALEYDYNAREEDLESEDDLQEELHSLHIQ